MTERRRAFAALAVAGVLWGASFPLGKVALEGVGPTWLIVLRFAIAAAVMLPAVRWRRLSIARRDWALIAVGAVLAGPVVFVLQFEGLARTTASSAALLVAVAPPLLAVGAALVDGERAGRMAWTAIAVSTAGVVMLVGAPGPGRSLAGDLMCAVAMAGAVVWTLLARRLTRRLGALPATALQFAVALAILVPMAWLREGALAPVSGAPLAAVVALGLGCTAVTFWLWNWGVARVEAARAGVIANVEPVVGTALGVAFLGDVLGPWTLAGGALLVASAVLATRPDRAPLPVPA